MRFGFADPPYPGCAASFYGTPEVNHEFLIRDLVDCLPRNLPFVELTPTMHESDANPIRPGDRFLVPVFGDLDKPHPVRVVLLDGDQIEYRIDDGRRHPPLFRSKRRVFIVAAHRKLPRKDDPPCTKTTPSSGSKSGAS